MKCHICEEDIEGTSPIALGSVKALCMKCFFGLITGTVDPNKKKTKFLTCEPEEGYVPPGPVEP